MMLPKTKIWPGTKGHAKTDLLTHIDPHRMLAATHRGAAWATNDGVNSGRSRVGGPELVA